MTRRRLAVRILIGLVAFLVLIQFVPYGHSHANPPVTRAVKWSSPETARLFASACQDCHSNLTDWRWYDKVAPASWLVQNDVDGGRKRLNVSEWNKPQPDVGEIVRVIQGGGMPPLQYKVIHPGGRLSTAQRNALARGFEATYRKDPPTTSQHGD
jgi:mono/diheme cytochrome c family protein